MQSLASWCVGSAYQYIASSPISTAAMPSFRYVAWRKRIRREKEMKEFEWRERHRYSGDMKKLEWETVVASSFSWKETIKKPNSRKVTAPGDALVVGAALRLVSRDNLKILSCDDEPLVYFLPRGLEAPLDDGHKLCSTLEAAIDHFVKECPPFLPTGDKRHKIPEEYKDWDTFLKAMKGIYGKCFGLYHLGLWHATGHPDVGIDKTGNMLGRGSVKGDMESTRLFEAFGPLFQTLGRVFQELQPLWYEKYRYNYDKIIKKDSRFAPLATSGRGCWNALALLCNFRVDPHKDSGDVKDGWVAMTCLGKFSGGELCLPQCGVRIPYEVGDVVLFRASVLEHWIMPWEGKRYSMVFFTKAAGWDIS